MVGAGPCGLFAGLILAQMGFRPIILDRGKVVRERTKDTWGLWRRSVLNPESNVQFGEGGAGTFSDGKLYSRIKDPRHLDRKVLTEFVRAGAPPEILTEAHPHIGTFRLVTMVESLRETIEGLGGEYRFETRVDAKPPANANDYSSHSFNANFAEVWVNELTGMVRVKRVVAVTAAGRIVNPKTSRSQILGGVIWGIGMALTEESIVEPRYGNFITRSFADYHIPANLDIGEIETVFVNEEDTVVNKLGIKGIGEVGIVGVAGAVANAIYNATGVRVRDYPITLDKHLEKLPAVA